MDKYDNSLEYNATIFDSFWQILLYGVDLGVTGREISCVYRLIYIFSYGCEG